MRISIRKIDGVNILDLLGSLTLGDGECTFRETVKSLISAGEKILLLNFSEVPYIDSAGVGVLLSCWHSAFAAGGVAKVYHPCRKPRESLQLIRMSSLLLSKGDSEEEAIREVKAIFDVKLRCACPLYGCNGWAPVQTLDETEFKCVRCKSEFTISHPVGSESQASLKIVRLLKQYVQDGLETNVSLMSGPPFIIELVGRLELFSFNFLKKAWLGIRPPRRAIFDLSQASGHISDKGRQALLDLFSNAGLDKAAILMEGCSQGDIEAFPPASPIHQKKDAAFASLGDISSVPPWIVEISPLKPNERVLI
jgi:anti-sigma B factor antagonist